MLTLYILLVLSTLAVVGTAIAVYMRVRKHTRGGARRREASTGEADRQEPPAR